MRSPKASVNRQFDGSNIFSTSTVYLLSNMLSAAIPFAMLPILTRYLSAAEYGEVAIYQTLLAGLGALIGVSAQGAASIKYYDNQLTKNDLKIFIGNCFFVLILSNLVILLIVLVFNDVISEWLAIEKKWILVSVAVASASFIISMRATQWQVRKQAKRFGLFQVSQSVLNICLSLMLVVYFSLGSDGRILALSAIPIIFMLIAVGLLFKDDLLGFEWRSADIVSILRFGIPLIPHSVGAFLLSSVDRFVINDKLGLAQVGIYMVAAQLVAVMGLVFDAINNAYVPWLFERLKRGQTEEKIQIVLWTYAYFVVLICVAGMAFIIGGPLLILVAGKEYSAASEVVGWLALGQAFNGMYLMVTNYVFYSKRTGLLSLSTIVAGLINIGLLYVLINEMGLQGAAVAYAVSMALKFFMTWLVANLRHPMPWFNFNRSN